MFIIKSLWYNEIGDKMRLRNVKGAKEKIEASKYIILDYEKYRGHFNEVFPIQQPIHIEIGTGKGKFIKEMALAHPDINYIGIEKFDSVIVRALEKIDDEDIPNLRLIRMDACDIEKVFDHEISKIYLNFSDPWPKERHTNRRLTSERFLHRYDQLFKDDKVIEFKTDNRDLFTYSLKSFTDYGYHISFLSLDLYADDVTDNIATEYEEKFHALGKPIYKVTVYKSVK